MPSDSPGGDCTSNDNMHGHGWGAVSDLASDGEAIQVEVPAGFNRNVSVYGIYPSEHISECGGSSSGGSDNGQGFFLGEEADDILESMSMSIDIDYNPGTPPNITCTGGNPLSVTSVFPYGGVNGTHISINGGNFLLGTEVDLVDPTTNDVVASCVNPNCDVGSPSPICNEPPTKPYGDHTLSCVVYDYNTVLANNTIYKLRLYHPSNGSEITTTGTFEVDSFKYVSSGVFISLDTNTDVYDFENLTVNSTSANNNINICNTGSAAAALSPLPTIDNSPTVQFHFPGGNTTYAVSSDDGTCSSSLNANSCCMLYVQFHPLALGPQTRNLSVYESSSLVGTKTLTGTGI